MSSYFTIDRSELCVVAVCQRCTWREIATTPATAWTACARHAKNVHGDTHAVGLARAAMRAQMGRELRGY